MSPPTTRPYSHGTSLFWQPLAAGLMRQHDACVGCRDQVERDVAKRLGTRIHTPASQPNVQVTSPQGAQATSQAGRACTQCSTVNDADARFCKGCGSAIA